MEEPRTCEADFMEANLDCELPAGHEGDHQCTFTWPQTDYPRTSWQAAVTGAYLYYLQQKYGVLAGQA